MVSAFIHSIRLHEISSDALGFLVRPEPSRYGLRSIVNADSHRSSGSQYTARPPPNTVSPIDKVNEFDQRLEDWKKALPMQSVRTFTIRLSSHGE